jgi:hypothetical protein
VARILRRRPGVSGNNNSDNTSDNASNQITHLGDLAERPS